MKKEVEIQVKIKSPIEAEKKIRRVAKYLGCQKQKDTYFVPPNKNYFTTDPPKEYIRVRDEKNKEHFGYMLLHFDKKDKFKLISTDEYEVGIKNPKMVITILQKIGLINKINVEKERKYFANNQFIITLDKINGLGNYMEIEGKKIIKNVKNTLKIIHDFLRDLRINYTYKHRQGGYPRMLYLKKYKNIRF